MTRPGLVIFDCDGVLVDSEPPVFDLLMRYFTKHGLQIDPNEARRLFIGGTLHSDGDKARKRGADLPEDWLAHFTGLMFDRLRDGVPVIPGVMTLIDAIEDADIDMAVVSNGAMDKMAITLTPSGLFQRFEGRMYSGYVHPPKPAPDMVQAAMAQAGVGPEQTVMIDDSAPGCMAGVAAGVRTFGFATDGQDDDLAAVGAEVVGEMAEIQARLGL